MFRPDATTSPNPAKREAASALRAAASPQAPARGRGAWTRTDVRV